MFLSGDIRETKPVSMESNCVKWTGYIEQEVLVLYIMYSVFLGLSNGW